MGWPIDYRASEIGQRGLIPRLGLWGSNLLKPLLIGALMAATLTGCVGTRQYGGSSEVRLVSDSALMTPSQADYGRNLAPFAIGSFDKLSITVVGMPELSLRDIQVDAGGSISMPLAGSLVVAGKTPQEVQIELTGLLRRAYVRNPQVAVNITETSSQTFSVEGEVKRPGVFAMSGPMTLLSAVARAEGTAEFANVKEVILFRTVGGQRYAALYDVGAIRRGAYPDPQIFARDIVVVGDSPQRRLFRDFLQVVPLLTTPLIVALQN
jgi:polysaccharide export outer membrane protein